MRRAQALLQASAQQLALLPGTGAEALSPSSLSKARPLPVRCRAWQLRHLLHPKCEACPPLWEMVSKHMVHVAEQEGELGNHAVPWGKTQLA